MTTTTFFGLRPSLSIACRKIRICSNVSVPDHPRLRQVKLFFWQKFDEKTSLSDTPWPNVKEEIAEEQIIRRPAFIGGLANPSSSVRISAENSDDEWMTSIRPKRELILRDVDNVAARVLETRRRALATGRGISTRLRNIPAIARRAKTQTVRIFAAFFMQGELVSMLRLGHAAVLNFHVTTALSPFAGHRNSDA